MKSDRKPPGKTENLFRSSFFRKLFLSYVLLIVVSLAVFCSWYLWSYNANQRAAVREDARQQAAAFATRTDQNLLIAQSLAGAMNSSEILRSMYQAVCIEKKTPDSLLLYRSQSELSRVKASSGSLEVYAILLGFEGDTRLFAPGRVIALNSPVRSLPVTPWIAVTNGVSLLRLSGVSNMMLNREFLIYADAYTGGNAHGGSRGLVMVLMELAPLESRAEALRDLFGLIEIRNGAKQVFVFGGRENPEDSVEVPSLVNGNLYYRFDIDPAALRVTLPLKALWPLLLMALIGFASLYGCYRYLKVRYAPIGALTEMVSKEEENVAGSRDLNAVLKGISDLIGERNGYREKMITVSPYASHGALHQLLSGNLNEAQVSALQEEQFWFLRWEIFMVGLVNLAMTRQQAVSEQRMIDARTLAAHACTALADEEHPIVTCPRDAQNLYVVVNGDRAEELTDLFYTMLRQIEEAVDDPDVAVTIGVSASETEPDRLRAACLDASAALENMITGGRGSVYFAEKEPEDQEREFFFPKEARAKLVKALTENRQEDLDRFMDEIWDRNIRKASLSPSAIRQLVDELHSCISGALREISEKSTTHLRIERLPEPATIEEIFTYYRKVLSQALITWQSEVAGDEDGEQLQQEICDYINANVLNPDLSLTSVADRFGVSSKMVGTVCRNAFGKTFLQYVRDCQIRKATELLQTTDLSLEEISEQCGFTNLLTFRRNFKATVGINPSDYRKK